MASPARSVLVTGAGIGIVSAAIGSAFTYFVFPREGERKAYPAPHRKAEAAHAGSTAAGGAPAPAPTPSSPPSPPPPPPSSSQLPAAFTRFGGVFPRDPETLKVREGYVASYDRYRRQPRWVLEVLRPRDLAAKADGVTRAKSRFGEEIAPVTLETRKGELVIETDDHIKPDTSLEALARLRPAFGKDGTVTAGNASGIVDRGGRGGPDLGGRRSGREARRVGQDPRLGHRRLRPE